MTKAPVLDVSWEIDAADFRVLLETVSAAARRTVLGPPAVELVADDGVLTARADDLVLGVTAWTTATVAVPGRIVVAYDVLAPLVSRLSGPLRCQAAVGAKALAVMDTTTVAAVRVAPTDTMPDPVAGDPTVIVPAAALRTALGRALAVVQEDHYRPVKSGVHLASRDGMLLAFGVNDHCVALAAVGPLAETDWPEHGLTIPAVTARALRRLLAAIDGGTVAIGGSDIASGISGRMLVVAKGDPDIGWRWSSGLIDGSFPDIATVADLNARDTTTACLAASDLLETVTLAAGFATAIPSEKARRVVLSITDGVFSVAGKDADRGAVRRTVTAELAGPDVSVHIDASYLRPILAVAPSTVELRFGTHNEAVTVADPNGPDCALIMPMVGNQETP